MTLPAVWGKEPMLVVGKAWKEICWLRLFSNSSGLLNWSSGTLFTGLPAVTATGEHQLPRVDGMGRWGGSNTWFPRRNLLKVCGS